MTVKAKAAKTNALMVVASDLCAMSAYDNCGGDAGRSGDSDA